LEVLSVKSINKWDDLREYGINALTGEADRTGLRILCDLTDYGKDIVCELFGIQSRNARFEPNWNAGANHCVMLPYSIFHDLAAWCLLSGTKCSSVVLISRLNADGTLQSLDEVVGYERGDSQDEWEDYIDSRRRLGFHVCVIKIRDSQPGVRDRATHAMSGRTT
jgi:hypothetical protein